jgi:hypothetical protein
MDPCVLVDCGFSARRRASPFGKLALGPACLPRGLVCFGACLFAPFMDCFGAYLPASGGWGLHVAGPVCCPKVGWRSARVSGSTDSKHELHAHIESVFKGDYIALDCVLDWLGVSAEFRYSLRLRWLEHGVAALLCLALACFALQRFALL